MHSKKAMHRDLKPENLIFRAPGSCDLVIADFGLAEFCDAEEYLFVRCGTPGYVAPEILKAGTRAGYGNQVDIFSAGVTLYLMLSGVEPFYGESEKELVEDNTQCEIDFPSKYWDKISEPAKDLVRKMLYADPKTRLTAKEALQHPWLVEMAEKKDTSAESSTRSDDLTEEGMCAIM